MNHAISTTFRFNVSFCEIQRKKKYSRAKSLMSGWAIVWNEEIIIHYLGKTPKNYSNRISLNQLSLFFISNQFQSQ
jgi:hypothetical protein